MAAGSRLAQRGESVMREKIITNHVFPPIPVRQFDWAAVFDNYEPGMHVGYGQFGVGA
jgi:hypothetical protein